MYSIVTTLSNSWSRKAFFDVVDALCWGVPSSILVPAVNKEYDIEIGDVRKMIALVTQELNEHNIAFTNHAAARDRLESALNSTGPIGDFSDMLHTKYAGVVKQYNDSAASLAKKQEEYDALVQKAEKLEGERKYTLGDLTVRVGNIRH